MASKIDSKKSDPSPKPIKKTKKTEAKDPIQPLNRNQDLTVVGIGASARGLQALQTLFEALPSNTGMAFVVITYLHPEHESHLPELLQTRTQMSVSQVTGLMSLEKDHVYVIPPNRRLVMADSKIDLTEFKEPRGQRAPIDYFFRSLARA